MEQDFLGPKPEAQWSLREEALVHQIAGVSEGQPVVEPQHQTSRPEIGRAWPKVTRLLAGTGGWEVGTHSCSLTSCPFQAGNSSVACNYSLKAFLLRSLSAQC